MSLYKSPVTGQSVTPLWWRSLSEGAKIIAKTVSLPVTAVNAVGSLIATLILISIISLTIIIFSGRLSGEYLTQIEQWASPTIETLQTNLAHYLSTRH